MGGEDGLRGKTGGENAGGMLMCHKGTHENWIDSSPLFRAVCCCNHILRVVFHFPISLWRTARFFFEALSEMAHLMKPNSSGNISDRFIRLFQKLRSF